MPQLDRFLSVMVGNKAEAIVLIEGDVATLHKDGVPRPITKQPLSAAQLVMLLKEIAPSTAARRLESGTPAAFRYANSDGDFAVKTALTGGRWHASIGLSTGAEDEADDEVEDEEEADVVEAPPPPPSRGRASRPVVAPAPGLEPTAPPEVGTPAIGVPTMAAAPNAVSQVAAPAKGESEFRVESRLHAAAGGGEEERAEAARADMDALLTLLVKRKASDLHLRCGEPPIIRVDGEMTRIDGYPVLDNDGLEAMLKAIMPAKNRQEYADKNDTDFAYEIDGVARFRCNGMRERKGAAGVFRVIPTNVATVEQLGLSQDVQNLCYLSKGLVLVTGPTGSGKSTTLCALVDLVNRVRTDHVITIEDPIEFVHKNKKCVITQRQVGVHTSSFKSALRAALREDPDIILVGELRDLETVSIAIETAETGHLVFGTLHTTTAPSTIDRIIDQFPADRQDQIRVMLSESLKGVISQSLLPKIGGGRVAAREILLSIPAVSNLIREGKTFQLMSVMQTSRKVGMVTLNDALIDLVDARTVEPRDAYIKAQDKAGFVMMLKNRGHDVSFAEGDDTKAGGGAPAAGGKPDAKGGGGAKAASGKRG
jgi:twitching motility protein PilT